MSGTQVKEGFFRIYIELFYPWSYFDAFYQFKLLLAISVLTSKTMVMCFFLCMLVRLFLKVR